MSEGSIYPWTTRTDVDNRRRKEITSCTHRSGLVKNFWSIIVCDARDLADAKSMGRSGPWFNQTWRRDNIVLCDESGAEVEPMKYKTIRPVIAHCERQRCSLPTTPTAVTVPSKVLPR